MNSFMNITLFMRCPKCRSEEVDISLQNSNFHQLHLSNSNAVMNKELNSLSGAYFRAQSGRQVTGYIQ